MAGSILTLKIWTGTNTRVFLKNMDNKSVRNQRKTVSSSCLLMNDLLNENYRKRIEEIDNQVLDICALRKNKSDTYNLFEETQNECRQLISNIHRESIVQQDV